ncbi:MAG: DUF1127 domain-containing protein [Betaproteobacteria bacterium]
MNARTLSLEAQGEALVIMNRGVARIKRTYAPQMLARFTAASNDVAYATDRDCAADLDGWARRAAAANGFGEARADAQVTQVSHDVHRLAIEARGARSASLAAVLATLMATASAAAQRLRASWARARSARATYRALRELDARTLHDLGLDRSEMRSVAAEIAGESDRTRAQALRTLRALSLF